MKKRILAIILMLMMLCVSLTSCEVLEFVNNVFNVVWPSAGDTINNILVQFIFPDPNRCTNHSIVPLEAIAPTCTTPGVSGGQVCQNCGDVIVAQTELPALDHEYTDSDDADCNRCGYTRNLRCEHVHTETVEGVEATCTTTGRTDGEKCLDCGKMISGYEITYTAPHVYDHDRDAYCNNCGYERKLACMHDSTDKIPGTNPSCTEVGYTDGWQCSHCGEVLIAQQEIAMLPHIEGNWIVDTIPTETEKGERHTECTVCGTVISTADMSVIIPGADDNASSGLQFTLNPDSNSYSLVHIGSCTDTAIIIPSYYNGKPVTTIADGAFMNNEQIVSVVIPDGVLTIEGGAFRGCTSLESITISNTVTRIGEYAFFKCAGLTSITLPANLKVVETYAFAECISLSEVILPYGITNIKKKAFYGTVSLQSISLPESLEDIGERAFYYSGIVEISLPNSLKSIGDYAFSIGHLVDNDYVLANDEVKVDMFKGLSKLGAYALPKNSTITFKGTAKDWNDILIHPMNYNYTVICTDITFIH